jgi:hypothetical protein
LKLLVDHNLPPRLARSLHALLDEDGHEIVALTAKFAKNVKDVDWIAARDKEGGWGVLTRDLHIRTRPSERRALDNSRVVYFYLDGAWKKMTIIDMAAGLIRVVPKMAAQVDLVERGRFELPVNAGSRLRQQR